MKTIAQRLEARTEYDPNGGCWLWAGAATRYGFMGCRGRNHLTHRLAYEAHIGPIPDGLCVLHRCDVPLCINPQHLFLGTNADNSTDMCAKGRQARNKGEAHGCAKLTETDVREIREQLKRGIPQRALGRRYGVKQGAISKIKRRERWAHVV